MWWHLVAASRGGIWWLGLPNLIRLIGTALPYLQVLPYLTSPTLTCDYNVRLRTTTTYLLACLHRRLSPQTQRRTSYSPQVHVL